MSIRRGAKWNEDHPFLGGLLQLVVGGFMSYWLIVEMKAFSSGEVIGIIMTILLMLLTLYGLYRVVKEVVEFFKLCKK